LSGPKRRSTLSIIKSRMSPLSMPPVVVTHEFTSRAQKSSVNAILTRSPLSQLISDPSEYQPRRAHLSEPVID
jgi:hypothetical protein